MRKKLRSVVTAIACYIVGFVAIATLWYMVESSTPIGNLSGAVHVFLFLVLSTVGIAGTICGAFLTAELVSDVVSRR